MFMESVYHRSAMPSHERIILAALEKGGPCSWDELARRTGIPDDPLGIAIGEMLASRKIRTITKKAVRLYALTETQTKWRVAVDEGNKRRKPGME